MTLAGLLERVRAAVAALPGPAGPVVSARRKLGADFAMLPRWPA
jgi:hypothetical protein